MTYHECKTLDVGMNLGDQDLEEAVAAPMRDQKEPGPTPPSWGVS